MRKLKVDWEAHFTMWAIGFSYSREPYPQPELVIGLGPFLMFIRWDAR